MNESPRKEKPRHGGRVEEVAREVGLDPEEIVDFSANLNPLAPPEVVEGAVEGIALSRYPDDSYARFRRSVIGFLESVHGLRLASENVVPGNGSLEIIRLLINYVRLRGERSVLVPAPTFGEYAHQAATLGLEVEEIPYGEFLDVSLSRLSRFGLVFFCNPNNPTGELVPKGKLEEFAGKCREANSLLAVDEAFIELSRPSASVVGAIQRFDNLIVVRSLTKAFSIPGIRVGFGLAESRLAAELDGLRPSWNLNCFAVELTKALKDPGDFLARSREYIEEGRSYLSRELSELGLEVYPGRANFLLLDCRGTGLTASELVEEMARRGVLVRNADSFPGLSRWHLRVAVKGENQNRRLIETLAEAMGRGRNVDAS